ncbi:MAG: hypothetical protein JNJ88_05980 [Planctomycetes bacterium]|nr:hypothetical protein [Planctomycetota bacterium]
MPPSPPAVELPIPDGLPRNEPGLPVPDQLPPIELAPFAADLGVALAGPIRSVDPAVFFRRMAPDCMAFSCGEIAQGRIHLDACCQYGADADLGERDRILEQHGRLTPLLDPERRAEPWFLDEFTPDPEFPSGGSVRTNVVRGACIFLGHRSFAGTWGARGCALHGYALRQGLSPVRLKPHVCSLFPLTYAEGVLCFSADYQDYSCSHAGSRAYRLQRAILEELFGAPLVAVLDRVETRLLEAPRVPRDGLPSGDALRVLWRDPGSDHPRPSHEESHGSATAKR